MRSRRRLRKELMEEFEFVVAQKSYYKRAYFQLLFYGQPTLEPPPGVVRAHDNRCEKRED